MPTIVITGAHHNSALIVAQEFIRRGGKVVWFGHRFAGRGDQNDSAEYLEVSLAKIPFYELHAGKISSPWRLSELFKIPLGVIQAIWLLHKLHPQKIISFGGYVGVATACAAFLLGIPVYLHEQTIVGGKANLFSARFAKTIYLTWNSSLRYFSHSKSRIVGLPLRPNLIQATPKKLFAAKRPIILILGGKQGSHIINETIFSMFPQLTKHFNVIHQTGTSSVTNDYARSLTFSPAHYRSYGYISHEEIGRYYASADLVISRAGAHTAYELGILGKRAILIPYEHTTGAEQLEQARLLSAAGIASIILQRDLTPSTLYIAIKTALKQPSPIPLSLPRDAALRIVSDLLA